MIFKCSKVCIFWCSDQVCFHNSQDYFFEFLSTHCQLKIKARKKNKIGKEWNVILQRQNEQKTNIAVYDISSVQPNQLVVSICVQLYTDIMHTCKLCLSSQRYDMHTKSLSGWCECIIFPLYCVYRCVCMWVYICVFQPQHRASFAV